jgi:hypothetical protein
MMFIDSAQLGKCLEREGILVAYVNVGILRLDFEFLMGQYPAVPSPFILEIIA